MTNSELNVLRRRSQPVAILSADEHEILLTWIRWRLTMLRKVYKNGASDAAFAKAWELGKMKAKIEAGLAELGWSAEGKAPQEEEEVSAMMTLGENKNVA